MEVNAPPPRTNDKATPEGADAAHVEEEDVSEDDAAYLEMPTKHDVKRVQLRVLTKIRNKDCDYEDLHYPFLPESKIPPPS